MIELFATHDAALFDYISFRRDLEGLAAERAAQNATEADLAIIEGIFARLEKAAARRDTEEAAALDADFHRAIVEAAHNVVLLHMMRSLSELLVRGVFYNRNVIYGLHEGRETLMDQHRQIRDAIVARDGVAARRAVEQHMDYVAGSLREADRVRSREEISLLRKSHEEQRASRPRSRRRPPPAAAE
ncbi:MAG: FCD domain-containing protein [Pseudomonadota bacterium]